ncbi:GNAT family N-acetyltransferase [Candidatus Woesearchaeota archaeon]|nr:GNAT family N-acetyltransferase [Candidatus Woesearchaeota archaeon]
MAIKIILRKVQLEECLNINKLIPEFNKEKYSYEYFARRCKGKKPFLFAAYAGKKPVGYMINYDKYNDSSFYCWMTGVIPQYRNKGVLKKMMAFLEKEAKRQGYTSIKLTTRNIRRNMLAYLVKYNYNIVDFAVQPKINRNKSIWEKKID